MSLDRADWLRKARTLFEEDFGAQSGTVHITLRNAAGQEVTYTLPPAVPSGPAPALSPVEAEILGALRSGPLIGKALARRLNRAYDSGFRTILSNLVERGVLANDDSGYRVVLDSSDTREE
jgi:hypothetical protein